MWILCKWPNNFILQNGAFLFETNTLGKQGYLGWYFKDLHLTGNHIVFLEEGILWSMELHSVLYQHSALNWKRGRDLSWSPIKKSNANFFNWKSWTVGLGVITYSVPSKAVVAGERKHSRGGRPVVCNLVLVDRSVSFGPEMLLKVGRSHIKLWISGLKNQRI